MTAWQTFFALVVTYYAGVSTTVMILGVCRIAADDSDPHNEPHGM